MTSDGQRRYTPEPDGGNLHIGGAHVILNLREGHAAPVTDQIIQDWATASAEREYTRRSAMGERTRAKSGV